jgi:two-component system nitrate/nitrite sensor histidine kinase NarX
MTCVVLKSTDAWAGRLYVLEARRRLTWGATARYVLRVCSELEPASHGLFGVHHLRVRAQAIERSRIGRDLHDGVTQSMLGVEMMVAVLRRRIIHEAPALNGDLLRIHDLIRENIIGLREVTESGHLVETMSGDLLADLQEIVDRFQRHSGIQAKFVSDGHNVPLTLHRHAEAARLVHEGLVNVRKHSGAHRVIVRSSVAEGTWNISIEDDGRGFPFGGRKTQAELNSQREGPRTVMERARRLGAEVAVESRPGCGSRVAIALRLPVE